MANGRKRGGRKAPAQRKAAGTQQRARKAVTVLKRDEILQDLLLARGGDSAPTIVPSGQKEEKEGQSPDEKKMSDSVCVPEIRRGSSSTNASSADTCDIEASKSQLGETEGDERSSPVDNGQIDGEIATVPLDVKSMPG